MAKKTFIITAKVLCSFLVIAMLFYVGIGFFGTFHTKAIPCNGGYMTTVYQTEKENIKKACGEDLTEDELNQIHFNLSIDKDNKRTINTKYINETGEEINLQYKMNWYWSDSHEWSVVE